MRFREIQGNLFSSEDSLAHCVSADFHMSAGIALQFKRRFPAHQAELLRGSWRVGEAARVRDSDRYVFYLVTKPFFYDKPAKSAVGSAIYELARWVEFLGIRSLALPRIACGLDGHDWDEVREVILSAFHGLDVDLTVYTL